MIPLTLLSVSCFALALAHEYSSSSTSSTAHSGSDSDSSCAPKTVRFAHLTSNDDFVSAIRKDKKHHSKKSDNHHHHHHHHKSSHEHISKTILKSSREPKEVSYFSASKPVFQQFSYIAESGNRHPRLPGGPQKTGFTFSRSWQRDIERALLKGKKKQSERFSSAASNGFATKFASETKGTVKDPIDAGWWLVSFEAGRTDALNTFKFKAKRPVIVSVVDLFCRGDSFAVLDEGKLIAQTSRVRADSKCKDVVTSPQVAIEDGRWSSVVFDLDTGKHSISLRAIDNSFEGGMAAIRFEYKSMDSESDNSSDDGYDSSDSASNSSESASSSDSSDNESGKKPRIHFSRSKICAGYGGFIVIDEPFSMKKAGKACEKINARLANLNGKRANLEAAVKSVYYCLGSKTVAWVDAKDNDGVADLVLKLENGGKNGILAQPSGKHPVICEKKN